MDAASLWHAAGQAVKRVIFAPVANISRDYDDVRRFADAARDGINRAASSGAHVRIVCCRSGFHHLQLPLCRR